MAYFIGQAVIPQLEASSDNTSAMQSRAIRPIVVTNKEDGITYYEEGIMLTNGDFSENTSYLLRAKIAKMSVKTKVRAYLVKKKDNDNLDISSTKQLIKSFTIPAKSSSSVWYQLDCVFQPISSNYFGICLMIERSIEDITGGSVVKSGTSFKVTATGQRRLLVVWEEVGIIRNLKGQEGYNLQEANTKFKKIGVQGDPNTRVCVNHEQIYLNKNGLYEFNTGTVDILYFGIIDIPTFPASKKYPGLALSEDSSSSKISSSTNKLENNIKYTDYLSKLYTQYYEKQKMAKSSTYSQNLVNAGIKQRPRSGVIVDYLYNK